MCTKPSKKRMMSSAFSLVELVIVVTIIGILASIAIPRISRAARGTKGSALQATLSSVRKAVDAYYAEHGKYPGYDPSNGLASDAHFVNQLTQFTDVDGKPSAASSSQYRFGPYLRSPFPTNFFNNLATVKVKAVPGAPDPAKNTFGWVAVLSHGYFGVSATSADLDGAGIKDPKLKDEMVSKGASMAL